jgi:RNA polymerase sigma factor (sigma-70 family)
MSSIRRTIRVRIKNEMDADDVFQDLSLHILQKLEQAGEDDLEKWDSRSWIATITINFCYSVLRKKNSKSNKRLRDLPDDEALERNSFQKGNSMLHEDDHSRSEKHFNLEEILSLLNERDQTIIVLRLFENRSMDEIDSIMGLTNSAQYYKRAIESLRKKIGADGFKDLYDDFFIDD